MAFSHSPKIVTDGLVLCLDAADKNSYPGSGTTWTDLSGNGNNGTLSAAAIGTDVPGSMDFNGSDEYVSIPDSTDWSFGTGEFAVEWWMKLHTTSQTHYAGYISTFIDHWTAGNWIIMNSTQGDVIRVYLLDSESDEGGTTPFPALGSTTSWFHLCLTRVGDSGYVYINTVESATNGAQDWSDKGFHSDDGNALQIGRGGGVYANVSIPIVRIYKGRSLSPSEVSQNFNAQRHRFGV